MRGRRRRWLARCPGRHRRRQMPMRDPPRTRPTPPQRQWRLMVLESLVITAILAELVLLYVAVWAEVTIR